jgi:hypothetical protein
MCGVWSSAAAQYAPPRLFDGKPDLQGNWTNASITTLQRAPAYKELVIPAANIAAITAAHPQNVRLRTDDDLDRQGEFDGSDLAKGRGYNAFWIDPGTKFGFVKGEYRTSWIVDPADGQIPYTGEGRRYLAERERKYESFDGPESRPLGERCIMTGGRIGPPMLNGLYNNNYSIVQSRDAIVVRVEMVSHARVVRMNARHVPSTMNPVFGDSIGHWDGDTLVVETTNFGPLQTDAMVNLTSRGKVVERFKRVSKSQLLYEFIVEDPYFYSRPWRGEMTFNATNDHLYEYACHEGNYAMSGVLAGARAQEKN